MINSETIKPIAVLMHDPPYEINLGPNIFHFDNLNTIASLRFIKQLSDRVNSIFCGHVHRSTTGHIAKIRVMVATAVATLICWGEYPKHLAKVPIYDVHRYYKELEFIKETRVEQAHFFCHVQLKTSHKYPKYNVLQPVTCIAMS